MISSPPRPPLGPEFSLRYGLIRRLGQGAMGEVWLARDRRLPDRFVASKFLLHEVWDEVSLERFFEEGRTMAALDHPHVLSVLDMGDRETAPYMAVDYVDGPSLADRIRKEGPLPVEELVELARLLCEAMAHAHERGVLHRDLKSENLLLCPTRGLLVADFGLALRTERQLQLTRTGLLLGTPITMAPELVRGEEASPATDLYAAGVVLYEMATGRPPFVGTVAEVLGAHVRDAPSPPGQLRPELPSGLATLILGCLAKAPEARPSSFEGLRSALDGTAPLNPGPVPSTGRTRRLEASPPSRARAHAPRTRSIAISSPPPSRQTNWRRPGMILAGILAASILLVLLQFRSEAPPTWATDDGIVLQVGAQSARLEWKRSPSLGRLHYRLFDDTASRCLKRGPVPSGPTWELAGLEPGGSYLLRLEDGSTWRDLKLHCEPPRLGESMLVARHEERAWFSGRSNLEQGLKLHLSHEGERPIVEGIDGSAFSRVVDLPSSATVEGWAWSLRFGDCILASGPLPSSAPEIPLLGRSWTDRKRQKDAFMKYSLEGPGDFDYTLSRPDSCPLWSARHCLVPDDGGALQVFAIAAPEAAKPDPSLAASPLVKRSFFLLPPDQAPSNKDYRRRLTGLSLVDGDRQLFIAHAVPAGAARKLRIGIVDLLGREQLFSRIAPVERIREQEAFVRQGKVDALLEDPLHDRPSWKWPRAELGEWAADLEWDGDPTSPGCSRGSTVWLLVGRRGSLRLLAIDTSRRSITRRHDLALDRLGESPLVAEPGAFPPRGPTKQKNPWFVPVFQETHGDWIVYRATRSSGEFRARETAVIALHLPRDGKKPRFFLPFRFLHDEQEGLVHLDGNAATVLACSGSELLSWKLGADTVIRKRLPAVAANPERYLSARPFFWPEQGGQGAFFFEAKNLMGPVVLIRSFDLFLVGSRAEEAPGKATAPLFMFRESQYVPVHRVVALAEHGRHVLGATNTSLFVLERRSRKFRQFKSTARLDSLFLSPNGFVGAFDYQGRLRCWPFDLLRP